MADRDPELRDSLQLNLTGWLLAEGDILAKGSHQRVAELMLGSRARC